MSEVMSLFVSQATLAGKILCVHIYTGIKQRIIDKSKALPSSKTLTVKSKTAENL